MSLSPLPKRSDEPAVAPRAASGAWPFYDADEVAAVTEVLTSGRVNQWTGEKVKAFETAFASYIGQPHAVAVFNGTVALELALKALGVGPGDEVIVTPRSFMASASAVSIVGATPIFADVDADSGNITAETIAPMLTEHTRAILPVHLAGWPADMPAIMTLARKHGLKVIEDCAQSHGATIGGRQTGSFGDAAAFSFCQDKIMTTGGEGGMVLFRDHDAWERAWSFKDHGKSYERMMAPAAKPTFRFVHDSIGTNWRMIEMQAALGLVQLGKLDRWVAERTKRAEIWHEALGNLPNLRLPAPAAGLRHAYYKLHAFLKPVAMRPGTTRDDVLTALVAQGIRAFSGGCSEIYRERAFADRHEPTRPIAQRLGETNLMFEVHPTLDEATLAATARRAAVVIASFAAR
ncbi:MAG: DegT/DnrJ/EryC1/StrS family aminotransferase [Hyphomicrobiaceae bacterium]